MSSSAQLFTAFVFLSVFNAGSMLTLQLQHYGIYSRVGQSGFAGYIAANNRAAFVPAILPAMLLLLVALLLVLTQPSFMTRGEALAVLGLNVAQLASTFIWQRRLQTEMARTGFDESKIRLLISTNWIRTMAFLLQALLAAALVLQAISHGRAPGSG